MDIATLKAIKAKHLAFLKSLPNVVGVGIGPKIEDGVETGYLAIKVFVVRKVPPDELETAQRIPTQLDGARTDVEVLGKLSASDHPN